MLKYMTIIVLSTFILVLLLTGCGVKETDQLVAKVGEKEITVSDFEQRYRPREYSSEPEERDDKMKTLDMLIEEKLFAVAGEKEGMAEKVEKELADFPDRLAVNQLYEEIVVKRAKVSLIEQKRTYRKMGRELHGRHIVSKTKEEADAIYRELRANGAKNFVELARKSIDTKTKDKGGDLGWFSWGRMDPELQDIAYKLKLGQISKPFEIRLGWDILQIVDEREKKIRTFEEEKDNIIRTLKRIKMGTIANEYIEKLKKRAKIQYDTTVINFVISKSPSDKTPSPFEPAPLPVFTEEEGKKVIMRSSLGELTISEFMESVEKLMRRPPLNSLVTITQFLEGDVINKLLISQAKRMHLDKDPAVIKNYNNNRDNRIAGEYRKKYIVPRKEIPDTEIKEYYDSNKEEFLVEEKRKVIIVVVNTKEEAEGIYRSIKRGGDIKKIAKEKSIHHTKNKDGQLGPVSKSRFPEGYRDKAFSMQKGELSKPFKTNDGYCVMKLTEVHPETYQDFDIAKNRISSVIKNNEREEMKENLVETLKKDIPVIIHDDVLMSIATIEGKDEVIK
jgi:parvulin-like peptidyl-prolyl isomerase